MWAPLPDGAIVVMPSAPSGKGRQPSVAMINCDALGPLYVIGGVDSVRRTHPGTRYRAAVRVVPAPAADSP
jgi:hypothetical protein